MVVAVVAIVVVAVVAETVIAAGGTVVTVGANGEGPCGSRSRAT